MTHRFAVLDATGLVVNVVVAETVDDIVHPQPDWSAIPAPDQVGPDWTLDGDNWIAPAGQEPNPPTLDEIKAGLKGRIDHAAEIERLRYITGGAGQAMTYARKVEQARAADSDVDPDPADYPLLAASVGVDGDDIASIAVLVLAMDAAWSQIGAAIEAARLAAKKAINDAPDEASARAAVEAVVWPVPA